MNNYTKKTIARDSDGLIIGLDYKFTSTGMVDWKAMIPKTKEYYAINKEKTKEDDITKVDDKDLLLLLFAFKELVKMRGVNYIKFPIIQSTSEECSMVCEISWIPTYETENRTIISSSSGNANFKNTRGFASMFLTPIAENRAFVRCVRNFLGINILGFDEIGNSNVPIEEMTSISLNTPKNILEELMKSKNITFDNLKLKLIKEEYPDAEKLQKLDEIPNSKILNLIERIKKAK